jgi:hypothetical protein
MKKLELLHDIVGINDDGVECYPFKGLKGSKRESFSYTFSTTDNTSFQPVNEAGLRRLVEEGEFNTRGRVRMVPANANSTAGAGAMKVVRYKGRALPL